MTRSKSYILSEGAKLSSDPLIIAGREFQSRLIIGTGKFKDYEENAAALDASGAEIVTVAIRRVNLDKPDAPLLMDSIDPTKTTYLPNTAGCYTGEDAVRTLRLARELGGWNLVKLEVLSNVHLYPDMAETLTSLKLLVQDGFDVMVYCTDDPVYCQKLQDAGACAIMPLAAPIGSGLGLLNPTNIRLVREVVSVPLIVDAGLGTASEAAAAMELGADGIIANTAIAGAKDPIRMARAFKHGVIAGREAFLAGRIEPKQYATASSPVDGLIK